MIELPKINSQDQVVEAYNDLVDKFNFLIKHISLRENFDGHILENVEFEAGEEKTIYHRLGIRPQYRLVLLQEGNGVLSDTPSGWNKHQIKIKNNGAVKVTATIMLVKE